ncbi:hypothetical protein Scep_015287 [Stephania cephalantha]|uniref:Uncharacterized protein n=1 Tax=Stephania cephalantha TaxID=152367 RepID=A0AAP0J2Q7_9MAGN
MTFQIGSRNDRGAAGSRFASAEELHTLSDKFVSHDQRIARDSSIVKGTGYTIIVYSNNSSY